MNSNELMPRFPNFMIVVVIIVAVRLLALPLLQPPPLLMFFGFVGEYQMYNISVSYLHSMLSHRNDEFEKFSRSRGFSLSCCVIVASHESAFCVCIYCVEIVRFIVLNVIYIFIYSFSVLYILLLTALVSIIQKQKKVQIERRKERGKSAKKYFPSSVSILYVAFFVRNAVLSYFFPSPFTLNLQWNEWKRKHKIRIIIIIWVKMLPFGNV